MSELDTMLAGQRAADAAYRDLPETRRRDAAAMATLCWRGEEGERRPLVERLRAHAQLWRGAEYLFREHAYYCDEAADRIVELERRLAACGQPVD
jgi:hypothetical protein